MEITPELTDSYRIVFTQLYDKIVNVAAYDNYRASTNYDFIRLVFDFENPLAKDVQDKFDAVNAAVAAVANRSGAIETVFNQIVQSVSTIGTSAYNFAAGTGTNILNLTTGLGTIINQVISYVWDNIKNFINNIWFAIQPYLFQFWDNIRNVAAVIYNTLSDIWKKLGDVFNLLWSTVKDFLSGIWEKIKEKSAAAWSTLSDWLKALWEFITVKIPSFFSDLFKDINPFFKSVIEIFKDFYKFITELISKVGNFLLNSTEAKYLMFAASPAPFIATYVGAKTAESFKGIRDQIITGSGIQPEQAPLLALTALAGATAAGSLAHWVSVATEIFYPTKNLGLQQIAAIVADVGSYSRIIAASMGVMITLAIRQPFEYYIKKLIRPQIPSERTLIELLQRRELSIDDFRKNMAYTGYSEKWIDNITKAAFREPRLTELMYVYEDGNIPDDWLADRIRKYGIADDDVDKFLMAVNLRVMKTQRQDFYSATMNLFSQGFLSDAQFDDNLEILNLRKEAKELAKRAADLKYLYNKINDNINLAVDKYKKGAITKGELSTILTGLGITPDRIRDIADQAEIYLKPKPVAPVKLSIDTEYNKMVQKMIPLYIQQYRYEMIKPDDLKSKLKSLGLLEEYINLVISIEDAKKVKTATRLSDVELAKRNRELESLFKQQYIDQYRAELINEDKLAENLLAIGLDAGIVKATVDLETVKKYLPETVSEDRAAVAAEKDLKKKYYDLYINAYRKDLITEDDLRTYLLSIGIPDEEVAVDLQLEQIRKLSPAKIAPTEIIPA